MAKPAWLVKELEADDDDEEESEEEDDDEDDLAMLMNLQAAKPAAKPAPAPAPAAPAAASSKPDEDPMAALLALSGDKPAAKPAPAPTPAAPPPAAPAAATPAAKPAPAANTSMDNSSDDPLAALLTITKKPPAASASAPAPAPPPAAPGAAAPPAKMPPQPSVGTLNALAQLQDLDATSSSVNDSSTNDADDLLASLGNAKPPAKATPAATNSSAPPPPAHTMAATAAPNASAPPPPAAASTPPVAKASPAPPAAATPAPAPAPTAPTAASSTASDDPMAALLALSSTPTAKPAPAPTPAPAPAPAPPAPATPAAPPAGPPAAPAAKASPTPAPAPAPAAAPARRKMTPLERMHAAFNKADTDGSGYIEAHELAVALRSGGQDATPADVAALLARFDTDKEGRIDEDEFFEMVRMLRSGELKSTPQTATSTVQHYEVTGSAPVALTPRPGTTISVVTASYNDVNYTTQVKEEVAKKGALSAPGGAHTFLKVAAAGPTAKFVVTYLENGTPTAPAVDNSAAARGASVPPSAPTAPAPTPVAPTQPPPAPAAAKTAPVAAATPVAPAPAAPPATAPAPAPALTPVAPAASPAPPQPSPARPVFAAQASTPPAPLAPASSFSSEPPILQRDTPPRQAGQTGPGYATSTPPVAEVNPNRSRREPMFETNMSEIHAMSDRPAPSTPAPAPPAAQDSTVARNTQPAVEPGKFAPRVQEPLRGAAALSLSQLMVCEHPPAWYWRKPGISFLDDYIDPHAPPEPMRDRDGTLLDFSPMFEMGLGGQDVVVEVAMVQSPQKRWTRKSTKGDPSAKRLFKKRSALPAPFGEAEMVTATSTLYKARTLLEQQIDDQADQRSRAPLGGMGKVVLKEPLNPETVARLEAMPREDLRRSFFAGNKRLTLDDLWNEAPVNTTSTTPARDDHRSFANLARKGLAYERATDAFTGLLAANNNRQGAVAGGAGAGLGTPARGGFGEPAVSPISGDARDVSFASGGGALGAGVPLGGATGGTLTAQERAAAAMSAMGLPRASRSPENNNNNNALNTSGEVYDVTRKPFGARDATGAPDPYSGRVPDPAVTARLSAPVSGGPNWGATNLSARSHGSSPLRDSLWGSETRGRGVFGDRREAARDRVAGGYGPYGEAGSGTEMRPSHSLNASRGQAGLVNTVGNRTEAVGGPRSHYL